MPQGGAMSATKVSGDDTAGHASPYPAPYEPDASVYPDPAIWSVDWREVLDEDPTELLSEAARDDERLAIDDTDPAYQAALKVLASLGTPGES